MTNSVRNAHKPAEECICVTVDEQYRADEQGHNVRPTGVRIQMNPISEQDTNTFKLKTPTGLWILNTFSSPSRHFLSSRTLLAPL